MYFHATVSRLSALAVSTGIVLKHFTTVHIPQGDKLTISTFVDQTHIQRTRPTQKNSFQSSSVILQLCSVVVVHRKLAIENAVEVKYFQTISKLLLILLLSKKSIFNRLCLSAKKNYFS